MYFAVFNPYEHNNDMFESVKNPCFMCLEIENNEQEVTSRLSSVILHNKIYTKTCICDSWIHETCFNEKIDFCPICREKFIINAKDFSHRTIFILLSIPFSVAILLFLLFITLQ